MLGSQKDTGNPVQHLLVFHHQGVAVHLPHQAQYFGVTHPAENDYLSVPAVLVQASVCLTDTALQLQHHRAGAVNHRQFAGRSFGIGGRRFSVSPDEHRAPVGYFRQ